MNDSPCQESRQREVRRALDSLGDAIVALEGRVDTMADRLAWVRNQKPIPCDVQKEMPPSTTAWSMLDFQTSRITKVSSWIDCLLDELEV